MESRVDMKWVEAMATSGSSSCRITVAQKASSLQTLRQCYGRIWLPPNADLLRESKKPEFGSSISGMTVGRCTDSASTPLS